MSGSPFLDAFNAKVMTYEEIAKTFVPSEKFGELSIRANSILLGPRGSGKTTLMKMLSVEGQRAWQRFSPDPSRQAITYSGIYVPADKAWAAMVGNLANCLEDETLGQLVCDAAFATNIFQAVADTLSTLFDQSNGASNYGPHLFRAIDTEALEELVVDLADLWQLKPRSLSIRGIEKALAARQRAMHQEVRLIATYPPDQRAAGLRNQLPFLGVSTLDSVAQALKLVNTLSRCQDALWALLLDEFEIAPKYLQTTAMSALRGGKAPLIIKMALAPCGGHVDILLGDTPQSPDPFNDLRRVELWYADKDRAASFSRNVFMTARSEALGNREPEDIVGQSMFDVIDSEIDVAPFADEAKRTDAERKWLPYFRDLSARDSSFADYIVKQSIDIDTLDMRPTAKHGNLLRKIAPLVAFRATYRRDDGGRKGRPDFNGPYSGWDSIAAICEGNPRWLKGLIGLLSAAVQGSDKLPLSVSTQAEKIHALAESYTDMLKSVATDDMGIHTEKSVYETLEKIGTFFFRKAISAPFSGEIPMSFTVDDDVDNDIESCLRIALNHGAIISYDNPDSTGGYRSLRNKTFRLSYMLAPAFRLPLRKSKSVKLSSILSPVKDQLPTAPTPQHLLDLN